MRAIIRFIAFTFCLVPALVIVDPAIGNAFAATFSDIAHNVTASLSAHPLEAVVLGTASFAVDPGDITYTLAEWRRLRRVSASTERRMRKLGLSPRLVFLSQGRLGVTRKDDLAWMEAGGASGASAQSADSPTAKRNTGRNTEKATAASVAKRKATGLATAAPAPVAATSAEPPPPEPPRGHPISDIAPSL
jgi:hypothetical protein